MNTTPRSPIEAARRRAYRNLMVAGCVGVLIGVLILLAAGFYFTRGAVDDERIRPNATPTRTLT